MAKKENIIELNGKRYDAYSGSLLSDVLATPTSVKTAVARSMDGLARPAHDTSTPASLHTPVVAASKPQAPKILDISRPSPQHLRRHSPNKSATLIRSAVAKPTGSLKRSMHTKTHTHALVQQPKVAIVKKLSHPQVDIKRQQRAVRVPRSDYVRRYSETTKLLAPRPLESAAIKPVHASTAVAHQVRAPQASSMDVFERALQQANSHLEPLQKHSGKRHKQIKWGKRVLGFSAASLSVLVIAGFIVLQNQANMTIKYASHKAGITASLPSNNPTGFSAGKFTYSPGSVAIQYSNDSSGQDFALKQSASSWDSSALRDNFVASADDTYHTVQAAGRTVYTYGNGNATWVNSGIWYNITSNGSLTTNELVDLATSM